MALVSQLTTCRTSSIASIGQPRLVGCPVRASVSPSCARSLTLMEEQLPPKTRKVEVLSFGSHFSQGADGHHGWNPGQLTPAWERTLRILNQRLAGTYHFLRGP